MSRRARALGFGALALVCAALAASVAGEYRGSVEEQLGELRPVVVARSALDARSPLRPGDVRTLLDVRRIPVRFAPTDALGDPLEAIGSSVRAPVPAGAYLTRSLLRAPGRGAESARTAASRGQPVEIVVAGAGALVAGGDPVGERFDVLAIGEPRTGGGPGRTDVVAKRVELLALDADPSPDGGPGSGPAGWRATVAADRDGAIRLIHANSYARELRLIGSG